MRVAPLALLVVVAVAAGPRSHGTTRSIDDEGAAARDDDGSDDDDDGATKQKQKKKKEASRVLVLDLGGDVDDDDRRAITALVARDIAKAGLDVVSGDDLRSLVTLEGQKQEAGCAGDESCLADIAGALDARLVVSGFAGRLGRLIVVNLSLFDAHAAKAHGRVTVEAENLEQLPRKLEPAVDELVHDFLPKDPGALSPGLWVAVGSGVVVGAGLAVVAGVLYARHDEARATLLATSQQHEATQDDSLVVDLADQHAAVEDARGLYNGVGVPLLYVGGAVVVVGAAAVVAGVVMNNGGDAE